MRHRISQKPPKEVDLEYVEDGQGPGLGRDLSEFLYRMERACFLRKNNEKWVRLEPRQRLLEQYKRDGLVLFLGAGVSNGSDVPSWPALARALLLKSGVPEGKLADVEEALPSYITQFELAGLILAKVVPSDKEGEFVRQLHSALYEKMPCRDILKSIPGRREKQNSWGVKWDRVLQALQINETLKAVGDLLIISDGDQMRRSPQIHAVLTSNADNLLELYCKAKTRGKQLLTVVDRASVAEHPDKIPVYHLHGFLDARGENVFRPSPSVNGLGAETQPITEELLPDLIFKETEYYKTIANPAGFINHTPQSFFRRLNVLFIGTSLDDLNIRRWLHDSFQERVVHRTKYLRELYSTKYRDAEREAKLASMRHFWLRTEEEKHRDGRKGNLCVPKEFVEPVMRNLGVQVIWCKDYKDVRDCISELRYHGYTRKFDRNPAGFPASGGGNSL